MMIRQIKVCLDDNQQIETLGIAIGIWTVGPILTKQRVPSAGAWVVRSREFGIRVALFADMQVAVNFTKWLWRTYGDISPTIRNHCDYRESAFDTQLIDAIHEKSKHESRLMKSDVWKVSAIKVTRQTLEALCCAAGQEMQS